MMCEMLVLLIITFNYKKVHIFYSSKGQLEQVSWLKTCLMFVYDLVRYIF